MLRLFRRKPLSPLAKSFLRPRSPPRFAFRTMSTSHSSNEDLKSTKLFDVSHLKTLVTGGGTGIGLMITQALCANGATVYITGRREDALNKVVDQYSTGPGKIIALPGDITKKEECLRLASEISSKETNGIHLLVNNAGIARDDPTKYSNNEPDFKSATSISSHMLKSEFSNFQDTFETNITAHYFMTAAFVPLLAQGHAVTPGYTSSIVNITSISGVMKGSSAGQFAYAASKAGMMHLSRMLATTLKECGIRVNQIAPGIFPSEMTTGESDEKQKSEIKGASSNPAGRPGSDTDMGACILFLAGPGGLFLNNQILYPEGGNLLVAPSAI